MPRPLCSRCGIRPCEFNYYYQGDRSRPHWRRCCALCRRSASRTQPSKPRWQQSGYQKRNQCDRCGLRSNIAQVFVVVHVDGQLNNCALSNLRTVCANCQIVMSVQNSAAVTDLVSDF